jgi:hypothetical protein
MNAITTENLEKAKRQVISQFGNMSCNFDLAATLTFAEEPTDVAEAEQDFRHFMNRLNRSAFGNNWTRKAKHHADNRVAVIPVHENGYGRKRLHYHCAIGTPEHLNKEKFSMTIELLWSELHKGSEKHNEVKEIYSLNGWLQYILKEVNLLVPNNNNQIDVSNLHIF